MKLAAWFLTLMISIGALSAQPAAAIETTEFGIEPARPVADADGTPRLVGELRPGRSSTTAVRVWNRAEQPLTLALSVVPAEIDDTGAASLSGDHRAAAWVAIEHGTVRLAPGESRTVDLTIAAPSDVVAEPHTMAVLVQPVAKPGSGTPAVLQRLALVGHLHPGAGGPDTGTTPLLMAAAAGAAALAVGTVAFPRRRRGDDPAPPPAAAAGSGRSTRRQQPLRARTARRQPLAGSAPGRQRPRVN